MRKRTVILGLLVFVTLLLAPSAAQLQEDNDALVERLKAIPTLYNMATDTVREIFKHGQELGNNARIFTRVGDSDSTNPAFLRPMGIKQAVCQLGAYADLQETIDFFSVPAGKMANSFDNFSVAAINGLSTLSVLDSFWADPDLCRPNETPLSCEYRRVKPSVAIIMLGLMDLEYIGADIYRINLDDIIKVSGDMGVIPVLTTFPVLPDYPDNGWQKSLKFNNVLVDVAEQYQIPLINLWAEAQSLPDYGISADRTHLKYVPGTYCAFDGSEQKYGGTLRNLLTLQALDELRRNVLTG